MSEWKEVRLGDYIEFNPYRKLRKGDKAKKITMDMLIPHSKQIYDYISYICINKKYFNKIRRYLLCL